MRCLKAALLNIIMTGTGPFALPGVTNVIWMSTLIDGHNELSTCPTSCFSITGKTPAFELTVLVTVQVTLGTLGGPRLSTARSKFSTTSGRLCCHHSVAVVTFLPLLSVRASGRSGKGLALDSS